MMQLNTNRFDRQIGNQRGSSFRFQTFLTHEVVEDCGILSHQRSEDFMQISSIEF